MTQIEGDSIQITTPCHGTLFYLILNQGNNIAKSLGTVFIMNICTFHGRKGLLKI